MLLNQYIDFLWKYVKKDTDKGKPSLRKIKSVLYSTWANVSFLYCCNEVEGRDREWRVTLTLSYTRGEESALPFFQKKLGIFFPPIWYAQISWLLFF